MVHFSKRNEDLKYFRTSDGKYNEKTFNALIKSNALAAVYMIIVAFVCAVIGAIIFMIAMKSPNWNKVAVNFCFILFIVSAFMFFICICKIVYYLFLIYNPEFTKLHTVSVKNFEKNKHVFIDAFGIKNEAAENSTYLYCYVRLIFPFKILVSGTITDGGAL